jgi:hypothetical protein
LAFKISDFGSTRKQQPFPDPTLHLLEHMIYTVLSAPPPTPPKKIKIKKEINKIK